MSESAWRIYLGEIPHPPEGIFWVSFESDPKMRKTKANIYGRCLPCIQNLYEQLQQGKREIALGNAFNCWKITAIVGDIEEALALLGEFEHRFPGGHVYGKFGSGRADAATRVVVFHGESVAERDNIAEALRQCLKSLTISEPVQISRGCAVLYHDLLGDWQEWQPITPIKYPENAAMLLENVKGILYRSAV